MTNTKLGTFLVAACVMMMSSLAVARQCEDQWLPGGGIAGASSTVLASARWDPDGPGPRGEVVVLGGGFTVAGDVLANGLVTWDGEHWGTLGSGVYSGGLSGFVHAILPLPDGRLVVGGEFTSIDNVACNSIAIYDGTAWHPLGQGLTRGSNPGQVFALALLPSGDIVAGGVFWKTENPSLRAIARWNGADWSAMGDGFDTAGYGVQALAILNDGRLVAGGGFQQSGSNPMRGIAVWDGAVWTSLGGGIGGTVHAITKLADGSLVAGGIFTTAGGNPATALARWDGVAWSAFAPGIPNGYPVYALATLSDGHVVVGGRFNKINNITFNFIGEWDGTQWLKLQSGVFGSVGGVGPVNTLTVLGDGSVLVGGSFTRVRGSGARNVAIWDRSSWHPIGSGFDDSVYDIATSSTGEVYACGQFRQAEGTIVNRIARRTQAGWEPLGDGLDPGSPNWTWAETVTVMPNGDVIVGGNFSVAGSVPASAVARWDGSQWHALGAGIGGAVYDMAINARGDLIVAGIFSSAGGNPAKCIARWDGAQWTPIGNANFSATSVALAPSGDIYVGGYFTQSDGAPSNYVAHWDGTQWLPLGTGIGAAFLPLVDSMIVLQNGDLVIAGSFDTAGGVPVSNIARWQGAQWYPMGAGLDGRASALAILPDGRLLVGGAFKNAGSVPARGLAIWDGVTWSPFNNNVSVDAATSVAVGSDGDIYVGGCLTAGGQVSGWFAHFGSPCNCPADFNKDGFVNGNDYDEFAELFDIADPGADVNGDGFVNGNDYDEFADHFDVGC